MEDEGTPRGAAEWMKAHIGKGLWIVAGLAASYVLWDVVGPGESGGGALRWIAVAIVALVAVGHFVHAFTRNQPRPTTELGRELRTIFIYGYVLQGLALGTGLLLLIGADSWVPQGKLGGLVYGCQVRAAGYGSELIGCSDEEPVRQWLLHIGSRREGPFEAKEAKSVLNGVDLACDVYANVRAEVAAGADAEAVGNAGAAQNPEAGADAEPEANAAAEERSQALAEAESVVKGAIREAFEQADVSVGEGVVSAVGAACGAADAGRRMRMKDVLLANGVVSKQYELRGGLVVPLYVVVLSLMGAAVGMSRRLPEIQRQAAHSVQSSGKGISPIVARERVVFQIMQVLAAPLIAVTAFAALEPDTFTAAVLIGFISGFASEVVLVKLRQASEALGRSTRTGA